MSRFVRGERPKKPMVMHKGVAYYSTRTAAMLAAREAGLGPHHRIVEYERGFAVQLYKSGPYLPETTPDRFAPEGYMANPREQFLNDPDDIKWLKETHLKGKGVRAGIPSIFRSFVIRGNEDSPDSVDLYARKEPKHTDGFMRVRFRDGKVHDVSRHQVATRENPPLGKVKQVGSNMTEVEHGQISILYSYETPVAIFVRGIGILKSETRHSVTTSKHINKWAQMHGLTIAGKISQDAIEDAAMNGTAERHIGAYRKNPGKQDDRAIVGYIDPTKRSDKLRDGDGNDLGWTFDSTISNWRLENGDKVYAIVIRRDKDGWLAGGYSLGDGGELFRGEKLSRDEQSNAFQRSKLAGQLAVSEAEYWMQRDAEDDDEDDDEDYDPMDKHRFGSEGPDAYDE